MMKLQNKTPEVRFPEFNDSWEHKELNELLSESKKKNKDLKYSKEEVLSVSGELGIVNQIEHLGRSYAGVSVHNYGVVEVGDIVYTKSPLKANPYGIIKINKGKSGIVSTLYAVYKVNEKTAYGDFLDYYFSLDANTNRYLRPLVRKGAKNTLQVTDDEAIKGKMFLPKVNEQKRIANFFSVLDNKTDQLKEKKTLLEEYKKGVMQKIFSQEIRFKDDEGKEFPEWEMKKLGEGIDFLAGYAFDSKLMSNISSKYQIIKMSNVYKNELRLDRKPSFWNDLKVEHEKFVLKIGDAVLTLTGTVRKKDYGYSVVINEKDRYVLNQRLVRLRNVKNITHNIFLKYLVSSDIFLYHFFRISKGGTGNQTNVSVEELKEIKVARPNVPEQIKIANFLTKIDDKIITVTTQIEETNEYKKGLLQKMYCV